MLELRRGCKFRAPAPTDGRIGAGGASVGLLARLGGELDLRRGGKCSLAEWTCATGRLVNCGLTEEPLRRCTVVDVLEVGETAWDASDSTSSRECACHPLLTFTMA